MDRLVSLFSVYDFFGYVMAGGSLIAGTYWAFAELPPEPGTAAVLGIIAASYAVGHLVQSVANLWEGWLWKKRGRPSSDRMSASSKDDAHEPYDAALQALIKKRVEAIVGSDELSVGDMFAVARAELRARQLEGRAELMNAMYGLCRGLTTSCVLLIPIFITAGIDTDDWTRLGIALGVVIVAAILYARRATRYSYRFADQVWKDFAALPTSAPPTT
jgi:hypothetical protein